MVVPPVPQRPVLIIGYSRALNDRKERNDLKTIFDYMSNKNSKGNRKNPL